MIRPLLHMGDARLLQIAHPVLEFDTPALHALLADMRDTMRHLGGVGLAAPQIGVSLRVVIFGFEHSARYPDAAAVPETVLINPLLTPMGDAQADDWEGCLSLPGLRGVVPRWQHLHYSGCDAMGQLFERRVEGFHARVVQHECDHLDGLLYPMRITDFRRFGFVDALPGQGAAASGED
ncbi:MAG: peptide deformylase [Sterolibacterium sp.]|jgi:peptide deformylase|nr:peptide deformylase [Sterolibacterium sp.]